MQEQAQVRTPPTPAPRPRSRSVSAAPSGRSDAASRATWIAAGPRDPKVLARIAADTGVSKIAAPVGLAQISRVASADHSQAGKALTAIDASRGWLSQTRLPAGSLMEIAVGFAPSFRPWVLKPDSQLIRPPS